MPAGFNEAQLLTGLSRPVALAFISGGRLLIGEQGSPAGSATATARIRVFRNGALLAADYATVSPVYRGTGGANNNESGFLGLAVDPAFDTNGYVYAFVSISSSEQVVYRWTTVGDIGTARVAMVSGIPFAAINHDGGGLCFGPDGFLYVAVGENNTTITDAQLTTNWKGKVLRFDTSTVPATAAPGNPFGAGNAVYTYGHRHPFRICVRPGTSQMFCAENGPSSTDEINLLVAGGNYGWPTYTGPTGAVAGIESPTYYTSPGTIAITDLLFYPTGSTMPFGGDLFYVGYGSDIIYRARVSADGRSITSGPFSFVTGHNEPVDIEVGVDGALYFCTLSGEVWRVQADGAGNFAPFASFTRTPASGPPPLSFTVDGSASYDHDGSIASHSWTWDDGTPAGSGASAGHTYTTTGTREVTLTVTDSTGATGSITQDVVCISAGNSPPSAHIELTSTYGGSAPLSVTFQGHGHDVAPVGDILDHRWDFGDGSAFTTFSGVAPDANTTVSHTFATPGTYTVTLRVRDAEGITAKNTVVITVTGGGGGGGGGCGLVGWEPLVLLFAILAVRRRR